MRAISQISVAFAYQSFLDSTQEEKALLLQPTNELIVNSTKAQSQGEGYVVGLAGFSGTPVAFRFFGSDRDSGVVILRPGQVIRPGKFYAFEYGLPFGWLGGGHALIYVGHAPDSQLDLGSPIPEIIFHRSRLQIQASANPLPALKRNWPLQFPWTRAARGTSSADQRGAPILRVQPTRALMRLRSAIVAPASVGFVFRGSREFDEDSTGTVAVLDANSTSCEVAFPASTDPLFQPFPMASLPLDFLHLACDEGGLTALDLGVAALTGIEIDIVRFGRL